MDKAILIGKRVTKYGMKLMASFHFSDFYADPAIQKLSKAWAGFNLDQKIEAAKTFISQSIQRFKDENINLGIVALGNEITTGFCEETEWPNIVKILSPCAEEVRKILPGILIAVHFTNPEREWGINYLADVLHQNNYNYGILSTSYYDFWHGTLDNLKSKFNYISEKYNKKVLVAETSYPYTLENPDGWVNTNPSYNDTLHYPISVQGQANLLRNLIKTVIESTNGLGVLYWEPAFIKIASTDWYDREDKWHEKGCGWASKYALSYDSHYSNGGGSVMDNQALFDEEGKPLESLKVYNLIKYGNEVTPIEDGVEDISVNPIDFSTFSLPTTISVIYTNEEKETKSVTWDDGFDLDKAKNDETYAYNGKADNIDIKCIFENNSKNTAKRFVCSYYIGDKFLSPWRLKNMMTIRLL